MNISIMIVEDEKNILNLMKRVLEREEYKVIPLTSGEEAISFLKTQKDKIDVVVLDINLPNVSGIEVLKKIKNIAPNIKILLISGFFKKEIEEFLKEKNIKFLQKPYKSKELCNIIKILLSS